MGVFRYSGFLGTACFFFYSVGLCCWMASEPIRWMKDGFRGDTRWRRPLFNQWIILSSSSGKSLRRESGGSVSIFGEDAMILFGESAQRAACVPLYELENDFFTAFFLLGSITPTGFLRTFNRFYKTDKKNELEIWSLKSSREHLDQQRNDVGGRAGYSGICFSCCWFTWFLQSVVWSV